MSVLGKTSRSYAGVQHDSNGLSSMSSGKREVGGFKTYRPPLTETHLKRSAWHDPHPDSAFSPLPPSLNIHKNRKERDRAGQRAELDRILEPGYKATSTPDINGDSASSIAGPSSSRLGSSRTAGGLAGLDRTKKSVTGLGIRSSQSMSNFQSGISGGNRSSVYVDSNGKIHDTEFDPFAGVSEMSRKKSRRKSAFAPSTRRTSSASSSSASGSRSGSEDGDRASGDGTGRAGTRTSMDGSVHRGVNGKGRARTEEEMREQRRRSEMERRRQDESAAKRRSMMSDRSSLLNAGGVGTPSIRSTDEGFQTAQSAALERLVGRTSRSSQGYVSSPLSPTFGQPASASGGSGTATTNTSFPATATTSGNNRRVVESIGEESPPQKTTQLAQSHLPMYNPSQRKGKTPVSVSVNNKKITVTGFDAPMTPVTTTSAQSTAPAKASAPDSTHVTSHRLARATAGAGPSSVATGGDTLKVPDSGRVSISSSRNSTDSVRPRILPDRNREDIFPETPAQAKRREERERRHARSSRAHAHSHIGRSYQSNTAGMNRAMAGLAIDTTLSQRGGRILPEIEIVEDDDPRIVFPENGRSTRVQTKHDHVIRSTSGPFAHALRAQQVVNNIGLGSPSGSRAGSTTAGVGTGAGGPGAALGRTTSLDVLSGTGVGVGAGVAGGGTSRVGSSILDENGGYLPSRWATGDRELRMTEDEKEKYRPREWGGKYGDAHGGQEEWRPNAKDNIKRQWKDLATNARFSMFRAKKKLLRKAEM